MEQIAISSIQIVRYVGSEHRCEIRYRTRRSHSSFRGNHSDSSSPPFTSIPLAYRSVFRRAPAKSKVSGYSRGKSTVEGIFLGDDDNGNGDTAVFVVDGH